MSSPPGESHIGVKDDCDAQMGSPKHEAWMRLRSVIDMKEQLLVLEWRDLGFLESSQLKYHMDKITLKARSLLSLYKQGEQLSDVQLAINGRRHIKDLEKLIGALRLLKDSSSANPQLQEEVAIFLEMASMLRRRLPES